MPPKRKPNQSTLDAFFAKPVAAAEAAVAAKPSTGSTKTSTGFTKDGAGSAKDASPRKRSALVVEPSSNSSGKRAKQDHDEKQPAAAAITMYPG